MVPLAEEDSDEVTQSRGYPGVSEAVDERVEGEREQTTGDLAKPRPNRINIHHCVPFPKANFVGGSIGVGASHAVVRIWVVVLVHSPKIWYQPRMYPQHPLSFLHQVHSGQFQLIKRDRYTIFLFLLTIVFYITGYLYRRDSINPFSQATHAPQNLRGFLS